MGGTLRLILFVLPLGLDTFAVSAALGLQGLPKRGRLRVSLALSGFEMVMPLAGLFLGRALGAAIGGKAPYVAAAALILLGGYMLREDEEGVKVAALRTRAFPALIGLGLSISLDELAMGFTIGLLQLPLTLAIVLIGAQAFVLAQFGLRLGARLGESVGAWSERLAAVALIGLGISVFIERALA